MRIVSIALSTERMKQEGLHGPLRVNRLGKWVVLVGPNGGGKSRLLRVVDRALAEHDVTQIERMTSELSRLRKLAAERFHRPDQSLLERSATVNAALEALSQLELDEKSNVDARKLKFFTPVSTTLADDTRESREASEQRANSYGAQWAKTGTNAIPRIRQILDSYFNATHPSIEVAEKEKLRAIARYESLQSFAHRLLGTRFQRDLKGNPALFDRPLANAHLSQGQILLLQIATPMEAHEESLSRSIVALDEPEAHVHPRTVLEFLRGLDQITPEGQIWIATHSVHVLAEALWRGADATIIYVENGHCEYAGTQPQRVLGGLVGSDEDQARVAELLELPAKLFATRFACECLTVPAQAPFATEDPQLASTREIFMTESRRLKIIDFGCGGGRLLHELGAVLGRRTVDQIDYFGLEPAPPDTLRDAIRQVYGDDSRLVTSEAALAAIVSDASVDFAVMMNVLHEIPCADWVRLLGPNSMIRRLLKSDGHLLVVEDLRIPVGEQPHPLGFLLLAPAAMQRLFGDDGQIVIRDGRPTDPGRLMSYQVPCALLDRVTKDSVANAIQMTVANASERLRTLRALPAPTAKDGRDHALYALLFANASLALQ